MRAIKFIKTGLASLLVAGGAFVAIATIDPSNNSASAARCSSNDVIDCGVSSVSDMRDAYNSDRTKGAKNIFSYAGISSDMVNKGTVKNGTLYKDGRIVVGGKTVATGAHTIGRHHMPGSAKHTRNGTTFYSGPANVRLVSDARPLFVFFDKDGQFTGAVMKECGNPIIYAKPVPKPAAECTNLAVARIGARSFKLDARASTANGATISGYTYTISPAAGGNAVYSRTVTTTGKSSSVQTGEIAALKYDTSYTVRVTVKTSLGNKTSTVCSKTVKTEPEQTVKVCDPKTGKIITVKKSEASKYEKEDSEKCKPVEVCDPKTGKTTTVQWQDKDKYLPVDDKACQPKEGEAIVCDPATGKVITVKESERANYLDKDSEQCKEKPVVKEAVTELPKTGVADTLTGFLGLGTITTASYYYIASRRNG